MIPSFPISARGPRDLDVSGVNSIRGSKRVQQPDSAHFLFRPRCATGIRQQ
jgi:hypothetical protein